MPRSSHVPLGILRKHKPRPSPQEGAGEDPPQSLKNAYCAAKDDGAAFLKRFRREAGLGKSSGPSRRRRPRAFPKTNNKTLHNKWGIKKHLL